MKKPATKAKERPESVGAIIDGCTISVGAFTPTEGHTDAVIALAKALEANAQAVATLSQTLKPPAISDAVGIHLESVNA